MNSDRNPEPAGSRLDRAMVEAAEALWQAPFMVSTAWWNLMIAPYLPECPSHPRYDTHEQLVVPDPLEAADERSLFA